MKPVLLGVNIDHVATLRQARGTDYPDPLLAMVAAEEGGADGITVHLREDRRHIQDRDVLRIQQKTTTRLNLEMAVAEDIIQFAEKLRPAHCCLVPEKRAELTTEGGLNVVAEAVQVKKACERLTTAGIEVSLFIDPDFSQIEAAVRCGAPVIEIHTGAYADAKTPEAVKHELTRIRDAARYAKEKGLTVNAGHGLNYGNVKPIAALPEMHELNIGHFIVSQSLFEGLAEVVRRMKQLIQEARQ